MTQPEKPAVISMHQPNYLPWCGYFHKMTYSDVFVFLDSVQYSPKTYTNRACLPRDGALFPLSVPASLDGWQTPIHEVGIDTGKFARKHLATFQHLYGKCRAYDEVMEVIRPCYDAGYGNLADFNISLITAISAYLGFAPRFARLSELAIDTASNQLLSDIAKRCEADVFVSGVGAKTYIAGNEAIYQEAGVALAYQHFVHPQYRQRRQPFVPGASILDLIFNHGRDAAAILVAQAEPPYLLPQQDTPPRQSP